MTRGSVYIANLPQIDNSSVQGGFRPVIIIQNNKGNKYSPTVQVIPLTSRCKKSLPTHAIVDSGVVKRSIALAEQIQTIDKSQLRQCVGKIDEVTMKKINVCIMIQLGLIAE